MNPALPSSSQPIPNNLKPLLPHPQTPWNFSEVLFKRVQAYTSDKSFKLCEILNTDPDLQFILKYFEHQKPPGYSIKRVVCIHNPDHTQMFESTLKNMEREVSNPVFAPKGKDEEPKADRARALARWEVQASQFSPVEIKSMASRGTDTCIGAKVLPLWHGSTKEVCQSICWSGFTSFGKHHYFDENASKGNTKSTDKGYFGAGIYFTNSAHYAKMYSSGGNLLLSWVSMREPYPVVNDKPHPQKGNDMIKLEGRMHYQNYNAHYIPVASIRPYDLKCIEYYPCYKDQSPAWDEFVVFHTSQALPRFWIELGVDFPNVSLSSPLELKKEEHHYTQPVNSQRRGTRQAIMFKHSLKAEVPAAIAHPAPLPDVYAFLQEPQPTSPANSSLSQAIVPKNRYDYVNLALQPSASNSPSHSSIFVDDEFEQLSKPSKIYSKPLPKPSQLALSSNPTFAPKVEKTASVIPFRKEVWAKYLGDVGEEPPLPFDIDKILKNPCPFFPGRMVEETHLLALIPKTVNGKPLVPSYLGELVKNPRQGQPTKYSYQSDQILSLTHPKHLYEKDPFKPIKNSYWILMTRDVISGSRNKSYDEQVQLLKELNQKAQVSYEVPLVIEAATCVFVEYLQTRNRLYIDYPHTYTRCQDSTYSGITFVVGDFSDGGLTVRQNSIDGGNAYGIGCVRKL
ncbi:MAG: hypothetical protein JSS10_08675 [Verrucomicrobia bacterium]|nr:hypothetical protein [Verrucomicrobiota bacterium]